MATSIGGWFDKVFFDAHGELCAGGELRFFQTGTDIPLGVATADGTPLGNVIRLDDDGRPVSDFRFYTDKIYRVVIMSVDGTRVKQIDNVAIPEGEGGAMYNPMTSVGDIIVGGTDGVATRLSTEGASAGNALKLTPDGDGHLVPHWDTDASGMQNPMTTNGDLIVGSTSGTPDRLGVGTDGDVLSSSLFVGSVSPKWEGGVKKYRSVYQNIPSPQIDDGYLGCLFYLSGGDAQDIELPSTATIPAKAFIDFVFLDDTTTLTITPQGSTILNTQGSALTIGGKSASLYRLIFLGRGDVGGVQKDQWALGGSDEDHKLLVSATDTEPDYLGAKLVQGTGIVITPQTDAVTGKQTLEFSASGGGGGGAKEIRQTIFKPYVWFSRGGVSVSYTWVFAIEPAASRVTGFSVYYTNDTANIPNLFDCAIYEGATRTNAVKVTTFSRSSATLYGTGVKVARGTFTSPVDLDLTKNHWVAFLSGPSTGSSILTFGEQIYGTVTNSTYPIGSQQNQSSCTAFLTSLNDSDGKMPGFMLHYEV